MIPLKSITSITNLTEWDACVRSHLTCTRLNPSDTSLSLPYKESGPHLSSRGVKGKKQTGCSPYKDVNAPLPCGSGSPGFPPHLSNNTKGTETDAKEEGRTWRPNGGQQKKNPNPTHMCIFWRQMGNVIECKQWGLQHLGRRGWGGGRTFGGVLI